MPRSRPTPRTSWPSVTMAASLCVWVGRRLKPIFISNKPVRCTPAHAHTFCTCMYAHIRIYMYRMCVGGRKRGGDAHISSPPGSLSHLDTPYRATLSRRSPGHPVAQGGGGGRAKSEGWTEREGVDGGQALATTARCRPRLRKCSSSRSSTQRYGKRGFQWPCGLPESQSTSHVVLLTGIAVNLDMFTTSCHLCTTGYRQTWHHRVI